MEWPSTVICPVRAGPELAVKEKLIAPPVTGPTVNQLWSLAGAKGPTRFTVAGITVGRASEPEVAGSDLGVGSN